MVRPVRRGDAEALGAFYAGLSGASRRFFHPYRTVGLGRWRDVIGRSLEGEEVDLVAITEEAKIVGHGFLWGARSAEPELGLGIADAYQGRGLGSQFLALLLGLARDELGSEAVALSVYRPNKRARHLYEKHGFRETHRERVCAWPRPGLPRVMTAIHMRAAMRGQKRPLSSLGPNGGEG
jgi:RimJ/RimL family protein N-acetyltransferase